MSSLWSHASSSLKRRTPPTSSYLAEDVINHKKRLLPGNNNGVGPKRTAYQRCKGALTDVRSLSNGQVKTKPRMFSSENLEGFPKLQCRKGKLRDARERSPCATPQKNRCSKMPFMTYLKSKIDAAGSVLGKTKKQRAKQVSEANSFRREGSSTDMPAVGYDYDECDLISCEHDLSEFNLLPEGFLPRKPTNYWASTPTFNVHEFHAFDGSRFSPMEEASLVLEDVPANGSMYSNNYLSSAECYVPADDSIEFLLGMKEFDGQEGLQGTVNEEQDFQALQINPKHKATKGLLNTGNQDCNVIIEDEFENVERPVCCAMEKRIVEGTAKSLQCTSACILDEGTIGTDLDKNIEIEESKTVIHIDHDSTLLPTAVISFLENKLKSFQYNSKDVKNLAPWEEVGMERKVEALEAELVEVKMQNKKLERSLKRVVRKTNTMEQSLHDRNQCLHGRRPVFCEFSLQKRRRRGFEDKPSGEGFFGLQLESILYNELSKLYSSEK